MLNKDGVTHNASRCRCLDCAREITLRTMHAYFQQWDKRFRMPLRVLAVEQKFEAEIMSYQNLVLIFEGIVDSVMEFNDLYVNGEFKSTARPLDQFIREESMSPQHTIYPYHLERRIHGNKFHGTLLDVARKATLTQEPSFGFHMIVKDEDDYDEFEQDAFEFLRQIARAMDTDVWPKNTDACFSKYGPCPYLRICETKASPAAMQEYYVVDEDITATQSLTEEPDDE
jgi:hypothetical protein